MWDLQLQRLLELLALTKAVLRNLKLCSTFVIYDLIKNTRYILLCRNPRGRQREKTELEERRESVLSKELDM